MLDIDFPFQSEVTVLEKGERLLLYTDGIPEATNERQQMFESETPLKDLLARHKPDQAEIFIKDLISDIKRFTGNYPQSDDITALYLLRR
jgi:sigma-B regulation protein RsbU (phosphoserine phosphatase)